MRQQNLTVKGQNDVPDGLLFASANVDYAQLIKVYGKSADNAKDVIHLLIALVLRKSLSRVNQMKTMLALLMLSE